MKKRIEVPKDLKARLGTPSEALWTRVRDKLKAEMESLREQLIVSSAMLRLSEEKISEEKHKMVTK